MDRPHVHRNRLDGEASPYLQAHADNPVHWQPWDERALEHAKDRDVPIFLSIGYAACHWCHVMADESFDDPAVAKVLNESFVPIKVDREERPDLDQFYQTACQVTSGRGGWPLSAWLTPDGRPFQVVTYLPRHPRGGMPGFIEVLERIDERWRTNRAGIEDHADRVVDAIERANDAFGGQLEATGEVSLLEDGAHAMLRSVDWSHGGFESDGPKFPQVPQLSLLLSAWQRTGRERYGDAVRRSLDAMADGGMYDHVGGGFHRYSTDPEWRVPHFEKMTYDNASLLGLYAKAAVAFGDDSYRDVALETASFMQRQLYHPGGGWYCSLDADTDGVEGLTYLWTEDELREAVDDPTRCDLIATRYGIEGTPELEGGHVLMLATSMEDLSESFAMSTSTIEHELHRGREELLEARQQRQQPARDEKILASWSGLAVSGFATAGAMLGEPSLIEVANETLDFIEAELWDADSCRLYRRYRDGDRAIHGFLEDYAAVAIAAFDTYWASDDLETLQFAIELTDGMLTHCWDDTAATLRFTPEDARELPIDPLDTRDRSTPSPVGLAVDTLATADGFDSEGRYGDILESIRTRYAPQARASPTDRTTLLLALDRWERGPPSVTIVADTIPDKWRQRLHALGPGLVLTRRPPEAMEKEYPLWDGRSQRNGQATLYPCRGRVCGPATHDIEQALDWLDTSLDR